MTECVSTADQLIVIAPFFVSSVIGRVDVDAVNFSRVGVLKQLEGVVVLCLYYEVVGSLRVGSWTLYLAEKFKGGVDRLAETGDRG